MRAGNAMRACFTSDLHGHAALFEQLDGLVRSEALDLLILGGDLFPDGDIDDPLGTQTAWVQENFLPRIVRWRRQAPAMHILCILGNHDWLCTRRLLATPAEPVNRVVLLDHRQSWVRDGLSFLGFSYTPPTPYWVKDFERLDCTSDPLPETGGAIWSDEHRGGIGQAPEEHFHNNLSLDAELAEAGDVAVPWIFVCHAPPYDTKLDRLPHLEYPVGSRAVRRFIESRHPALSLHGHIHESPEVTGEYRERIGATLCVNPGQSKTRLHAVLLDLRDPAASMRHTVFG